ncbi:MAG TPA: DNA cytosine methyltransferase [Candidatus Faecousia intestinigallinarum]|nr:DNA cytosine methyltransferase [Candidatus Faecousia intestinigallinarum]
MTSQINLFSEIMVDNFAGGGGASTGIELAAGRPVDIAINHDLDAVRLHSANHPWTKHLQTDIWDVDPVKECAGRPVGLAWFSPDCKHFSRAKGAALVDRHIRGLAWIALRWAGTVRPRIIMLENVPEFVTWGPVRKGTPIKKKQGKTFHKFVGQLRDLGYEVEWREMVAADYGAPTIRKRLVLVARCDGNPIVWPEPTHAPMDSPEVKAGKRKPWRSAAEIINWSIPAYSIFDSKQEIKERYGVNAVRPLADNTLRRVIRGVDKFIVKSRKPFIVRCNHASGDRAQGLDERMPTVSAKHGIEVVDPMLVPITVSNTGGSTGSPANEPVYTVRSSGGQLLSAPILIQYHQEQTATTRSYGLNKPLCTADASNRYGLASTNLVEYYGNGKPINPKEPLHTVMAIDHDAVTAAHVVEFKGQDIGQHPESPLRTITTSAGEFAISQTVLVKAAPGADLGRWFQIRELLNRYCGYHLKEDEVLLLIIGGVAYYIADILLRMLTPRELYNAMGFPPDYIIDRDAEGKIYKKAAQVARCGNAVCPPLATAMVRANLPEYCVVTINTMAELANVAAV